MGRLALDTQRHHAWTCFDETDQSDLMSTSYSPKVVGKTNNKEECRCKPAEVLPGPRETAAASWLSGLKWMSARTRRLFFEVEGGKMKAEQDAMVDKFKAAVEAHDNEFRKLQRTATQAEEDAQNFVDRYHDVRDAYEDGDCKKVAETAREEGGATPWCENSMKEAERSYQSHIEKPQGKYGATTLSPLVDLQTARELLHKFKVRVKTGGEEEEGHEPTQDSIPLPLALLAPFPTAALFQEALSDFEHRSDPRGYFARSQPWTCRRRRESGEGGRAARTHTFL
mmetsp:Transcript_13225/g.29754  ORF Transcript_13225/g.29754 Transcript_13225/m.29754 type:complete len:283 (-) Transcript_13225:22-870(-)